MPHLTASALQDDPEGLAFLRAVLGRKSPRRRRKAAKAASQEAALAPASVTPAFPPAGHAAADAA